MADDPMQQARALVEKWRESAASARRYSITEHEDGFSRAERACADELAAILATPSEEYLVGTDYADGVLTVIVSVKRGANITVVKEHRERILATPSESASVGEETPIQGWKLVGTENRPRKDEGGEFVSMSPRTGYFEPIPYDTFYRWETLVGYVGKSDKPPVASIVIRALPGDGKEGCRER